MKKFNVKKEEVVHIFVTMVKDNKIIDCNNLNLIRKNEVEEE